MTFGVTVFPEWAQSEGIEPLLDRLQSAGVTDIATSPYVMSPAVDGTREPPADAGAGNARLLDRELWGRRELNVRTAPSFVPKTSLYERTIYQPPAPDRLTHEQGHIVEQFITAAKLRGMKVWFQVQAAIPPGYRVQFGGPVAEDAALGPDDDAGPGRVDKNASLASPDVIEYGRAMVQDLARAYPDIDGIRLDWPEYPPYAFHSLFFDFCPHAIRYAEENGIGTDRMRSDTRRLRDRLTQGLTEKDLRQSRCLDAGLLQQALTAYPGVVDLLALRRSLSLNLIRQYRAALPATMALVPQAFPPPFNLLSGFDFTECSQIVQGIGVKVYTMHWPMIMANWGQAMKAQGVDQALLARSLVSAMGTGQVAPDSIDGFIYPEPDEPHPASAESIVTKIALARAQAEHCPVYAFSHSYGPLDDVIRRATAAWEASSGNMWINRYGYLSDEKIAAFRALVSTGSL